MYDLPEVRDATERWWGCIARALRREGLTPPRERTRYRRIEAAWSDPDMLMSQCCGYPLVRGYASQLLPVGTPCYSAPGCDGPDYSSVLVVSAAGDFTRLDDLHDKTVAVNGKASHSGYNCLRGTVAPLAGGKPFFARVIESGSHLSSLELVVGGEADLACIDCVTYALLQRHRPGFVQATRTLGHTMHAPGLPYVTRAGTERSTVEGIRRALRAALDDPFGADARTALLIYDISFLDASDYARIADIERQAIELGYAEVR